MKLNYCMQIAEIAKEDLKEASNEYRDKFFDAFNKANRIQNKMNIRMKGFYDNLYTIWEKERAENFVAERKNEDLHAFDGDLYFAGWSMKFDTWNRKKQDEFNRLTDTFDGCNQEYEREQLHNWFLKYKKLEPKVNEEKMYR